ncbi:hypothetical protein [Microbispora bryophytorum]|uniref:hypothetical protein n=1 Tax=Microbispora bryophytorum TaxID=1460882 RepID=UPI0033E065FB
MGRPVGRPTSRGGSDAGAPWTGRGQQRVAEHPPVRHRGPPRLVKGRTRGPVFVTHRKPGPGKVLAPRDICPDTGLVRLTYGQARALLDAHTAVGGVPGTGWDLHEYRHSGLTHLGEAGASLPMLMAKSRHKTPSCVRHASSASESSGGVSSNSAAIAAASS